MGRYVQEKASSVTGAILLPTSALDESQNYAECKDQEMTGNLDETARPGCPVFLTVSFAVAAGALAGAIVGAASAYPSGFEVWLAAIGAGVGGFTGAVSYFTRLVALQLTRPPALTNPVRQLIVIFVSAIAATLTVLGVCLATRSIDFAGILATTFALSVVLALIGHRLLRKRCI